MHVTHMGGCPRLKPFNTPIGMNEACYIWKGWNWDSKSWIMDCGFWIMSLMPMLMLMLVLMLIRMLMLMLISS